MKTHLIGIFLAACCVRALAVGVGDTMAQVIAEKGQPTGKLEAGGGQILRYPDATVKLRGGRVTSVEATGKRPAVVPAPVNPPAAAPAPAPAPQSAPAPEAVSSAAPAGPAKWTTDYTAALARAKAEKRHVFLFFTGSDWCGWCMRLQREILTTPDFARYAAEKLVLVELDFPNRKRLPAALKSQNEGLARKYGIRGYPSVIVLDSTGRVVGQLGYQEGGPKPFLAHLSKL